MADGFLSPEGVFYEKTEVYHAQTARRLLGDDLEHPDPVGELLRRGYLALIEFRAVGGTFSLQPDLDYVIGRRDGQLTEEQTLWLREHLQLLSRHQQYTINMDTQGIFQEVQVSDVMLYPPCENCPDRKKRMVWCEGRDVQEPDVCRDCQRKTAVHCRE